jgi:phosphoribosyl-ATP pyrophosphohydrolase
MKTKQELIELYRAYIAKQDNLEKNAEAASDRVMAAYHRGKKEVYKEIADYLTRWDIKSE